MDTDEFFKFKSAVTYFDTDFQEKTKSGKNLTTLLMEVRDDESLDEAYKAWKKYYKIKLNKSHPDHGASDDASKKIIEDLQLVQECFDLHSENLVKDGEKDKRVFKSGADNTVFNKI